MTVMGVPRCVRCLTFWRKDAADGYVRKGGRVYCADRAACDHRRSITDALARLTRRAA